MLITMFIALPPAAAYKKTMMRLTTAMAEIKNLKYIGEKWKALKLLIDKHDVYLW